MPVGGLYLTISSYPVGEESVGDVAIPGVVGGELLLDRGGTSCDREGFHRGGSMTGGSTEGKSLVRGRVTSESLDGGLKVSHYSIVQLPIYSFCVILCE